MRMDHKDWLRGCLRVALALGITLGVLALGHLPAVGASKAEAQGSVRAGKEAYEKLCAVCHGADGKGDGQALKGMPVRPKSFADASAMRGVSDQNLFDAIQKGGAGVKKSPMMPPFGDQIKDPQIWNLVAFIRSLAPPPARQ